MRFWNLLLLCCALVPLSVLAQGDLRKPDKKLLEEIRRTRKMAIGDQGVQIETGNKILEEPGTRYYLAEKGFYYAGVFAVHIPSAYAQDAPLPLVVSSHGSGGNGIAHIRGWSGQAEQYGFIAVCPSFGVASGAGALSVDDKMLCEIMERVMSSLKVDRSKVLGTGFSGGGLPTFGIMMKYPDWFTALAFRGANFRGSLASRGKWKSRPIYIVWGEKDHPLILNQDGPNALDALLKMKGLSRAWRDRKDEMFFESSDGKFRWQVVAGAGHEGFIGQTAAWFAEKVIKQ